MRPVVIDLDGSVQALPRALVLPLEHWSEVLRFACSRGQLRRFARRLDALLPAGAATAFIGSGDFHHLSLPLIARAALQRGPLDVVVFDNHPDNMRFPFGVHCGSWVGDVAALPGVRHVHVVGITSSDIGAAHAWENRLHPLRHGRLTYWSIGVRTGWARALGLGAAFRNFADVPELLDAFRAEMARRDGPVYLSIDKDVLQRRGCAHQLGPGLHARGRAACWRSVRCAGALSAATSPARSRWRVMRNGGSACCPRWIGSRRCRPRNWPHGRHSSMR